MRFLKVAAILMAMLTLAAAIMTAYFFASSNVVIAALGAKGSKAADDMERFEAIKSAAANGTFIGTLYGGEEIGSAEDYVFITYTVRVSNQCLVPLDMIEVAVTPSGGDVLQLGDLAPKSMAAKTQGDVTATILTSKDSHAMRELTITYYIWGAPFTIKQTYGA